MLTQAEPMRCWLLVVVVTVVGCTKPNPEYCDTAADCANGTVCSQHACVQASDGGLDSPDDGVQPDGPAACVPELLFQRGGLFDGQVFTIDLMTFLEHPVSNGVDHDVDAAWSPDGTRIALTRNGNSILTVDPDGSNPHQVDSQSGQFLLGPAWSPDGTRLVYVSTPSSGGTYDIYSASVLGSSGINLMPGQHGEFPEWSPDGSRIAFASNRTGNYDVFVMSASGSNQVNLTMRAGSDGADGVHWSPDGMKLVFTGTNHIWTMNADGTGMVNLTGTTGIEAQARWANPDSRIYFVKSPSSGAQLFVMSATGVNQRPLETNTASDVGPVASPDGSRLAWASTRDGNSEIYVSDADGGNPTRLTNNSKSDHDPRWRPCP